MYWRQFKQGGDATIVESKRGGQRCRAVETNPNPLKPNQTDLALSCCPDRFRRAHAEKEKKKSGQAVRATCTPYSLLYLVEYLVECLPC